MIMHTLKVTIAWLSVLLVYVLLGESLFHGWRSKGARLGNLPNLAKSRLQAEVLKLGNLPCN